MTHRRHLPVLAILLLPGGCTRLGGEPAEQTPGDPPVILEVSASSWTVAPGGTSHLEVLAQDPDGDPLTYRWEAAAGTVDPPGTAATDWTAPAAPGAVTLSATVVDDTGLSTSLSVILSVVAGVDDADGDGVAATQGDCNDHENTVYPGAQELFDGLDNDCDGLVDEDLDVNQDQDQDGFSPWQGDCDDSDSDTYPGGVEVSDGTDNDCDGSIDEGTAASDDDGDGYSEAAGDCDDELPDVHPDAPESPDGLDNDCDGAIDEGTVLVDDDGDGLAEVDGDCDDTRPDVHPGAVEVAGNGIDEDCDGRLDEGTAAQDLDGDLVTIGDGDCDDTDPLTYPGAEELPDARDNDCDGAIDEGTSLADDDQDGYDEITGDCDDTDPGSYPGALETPDGLDNDCNGVVDDHTTLFDDDGDGVTEAGGDCDDTEPRARPEYPEVPDGLDNDCDGLVDENTVYADADADGVTVLEGDCDDSDPATYPGAIDLPGDDIDNGCTATPRNHAPEAVATVVAASAGCTAVTLDGSASRDPDGDPLQFTWYVVRGAGAALTDPDGPVTDVLIDPDAPEPYTIGLAVSDGVLTGWEWLIDLDPAVVRQTWCVTDSDGDGFTGLDGDCDDQDPTRYPGADEICDGVDQDCDGAEILFEDTFDLFDPGLWNLEGAARPMDGEVLLTPLDRNVAGALFREVPAPTTGVVVRFSLFIDGGTGGGGMTFAVLGPDAAAFLGESGGGNGLLGLDGWGVEFDTEEDAEYGDPKYAHIAIVNAMDLSMATDPYRAVLRETTLSMEVRIEDGAVSVTWNGNTVLSDVVPDWPMPGAGYIGFTGSTSFNTDQHHVLDVEVSCIPPE